MSLTAAFSIAVSSLGFSASADEPEAPPVSLEIQPADGPAVGSLITYSDYYDEISGAPRPEAEAVFEYKGAGDEAVVSFGEYEGEEAVIWESQNGRLDFEVDVPETGAYNIEARYIPITGGNTTTELSVYIDGKVPFDTAERVALPRTWVNEYPIRPDKKDNEIRPPQVEAPRWMTEPMKDSDGLFNDPLLFYLTEGKHTISLESGKAMIAIAYIKLFRQEGYKKYVRPSDAELAANSGAAAIKVQGENYSYTTSGTIFPVGDRTSYLTEPSNPTKIRYNAVWAGDSSGESVTWEVNVEEPGYYKIGVKALQNSIRGLYSNRRLYIDGEVPGDAFSQIKFYYDNDWTTTVPEDENGEAAYVYLDAGKHYLTLECIPGEIGDSMRRLNRIASDANAYYREILMMTGPTPDRYTDYNVHLEIPGLVDDFLDYARRLNEEKDTIEGLSNQKGGSEAAPLSRCATILERCAEKPRRIPTMITNNAIKDNIAAISSWMRIYRFQPLEIDFIELTPADGEFSSVKGNFFDALSYHFKAFIGSFLEDYSMLSELNDKSVNVWVSLGREQTNVIKQLTDSQFAEEHPNIDVSINLVQGAIMEAVMAGKGPDVGLFIGGEIPVNLAVRGLVAPLDGYGGFDEVISRFQKNAAVPYTFDERVYGIPIQQAFPMMFYRADMLAQAGIDGPPETWDDLIDMLPAIQRTYMQPGLILPGNVASVANNPDMPVIAPSTEVGHTFALLMLQAGMNYYDEDQSETTFDSQEAVEAFTKWTDFYNIYKFDQIYDPFTRFRTGEAPIVIQGYSTFYNQLNTAAPEIKGLWDIAPIPGTRRADGTVSHAANSNGAGAVIFSDCNNPEAAWEFIEWFTSTEVMIQYGRYVEGIMGPMGRFEPAGTEVIKNLNWSAEDLEKIMAQRDAIEEIPIMPSSYAVTRSLMYAFRRVVNDKWAPLTALRWYNIDINNEIRRKRESLGLDDGEET